MQLNRSPCHGFTLTELAVVLVILALLTGGLVFPLAAQRDVQRLRDTEAALTDIREALLGYAALYGALPCPDTDTDPRAAGYGVEEPSCSSDLAAEGYLPFKTLGLAETDPWGSPRQDPTDPPGQRWRYRVDRNFANPAAPISLATGFAADSLQINDHGGNPMTTTVEHPIALYYSVGPNGRPDGANASFEAGNGRYQAGTPTSGFDDMLEWIARPLLVSRLIAAGKQL